LAFTRALLRAGATDLHVHHILGGIEIDLLVGGGAVASTNCSYIGLLEHGQAPCFQRAAREGLIGVHEYSEYMFVAGLRAAEQGLTFTPWKTPWQSDIAKHLGLKTVRDPYSGMRLLAIPATKLDVAVIQVERADRDGYVEKPEAPEAVWDYDLLIARVARTTIVCAEEVVDRCDPTKVMLIGREVTHIVEAPGGCWPAGLHPRYGPDVAHVRDEYLPAAAAGGAWFQAYLDRYVHAEGAGDDAD
jgi:glutaconate CoA-transferase subunit A